MRPMGAIALSLSLSVSLSLSTSLSPRIGAPRVSGTRCLMRSPVALLALALLAACSDSPSGPADAHGTADDAPTDGPRDAPRDAPTDAPATPVDDAPTCTAPPALLDCIGGVGTACCGGHICHFLDGPCDVHPPEPDVGAGLDGGVCATNPTALDCPCSGAGMLCIWGAQRTCTAGVWTATTTPCAATDVCIGCR